MLENIKNFLKFNKKNCPKSVDEQKYVSQLKTEISKYLPSVGKLNAKELVDLIGSGIQFIQENKDNKVACDKAYAEIEILLKYLKKRPEYLNNKNLKDVDGFTKLEMILLNLKILLTVLL